jgi:hypothetical protein
MRRRWLAMAATGLALLSSPAMAVQDTNCREVTREQVLAKANRTDEMAKHHAKAIAILDVHSFAMSTSCHVLLATTAGKADMWYGAEEANPWHTVVTFMQSPPYYQCYGNQELAPVDSSNALIHVPPCTAPDYGLPAHSFDK